MIDAILYHACMYLGQNYNRFSARIMVRRRRRRIIVKELVEPKVTSEDLTNSP
jgi:hypothetical protein